MDREDVIYAVNMLLDDIIAELGLNDGKMTPGITESREAIIDILNDSMTPVIEWDADVKDLREGNPRGSED